MKVFITGASSGIGLGLTKSFAADGTSVYACSRREPENSASLNFKSIDLANLDAIEYSVSQLLQGVEALNAVILNAGVLGDIADMKDSSIEELKLVMDVNLWSNKVLLDAIFKVVPKVEQVIAISSGAAVNGSRGWSGYSISKAALNMMIKLYAAERPETHFTAFAPGLIDTAIQDDLCSRADSRFASIETLKAARGTERMPKPDQFAHQFKMLYRELLDYPSGSFLDIRSL
jgi:NAD(P)-dependent dehydrogenase (short-subunit alcohol dehydrogenase family)